MSASTDLINRGNRPGALLGLLAVIIGMMILAAAVSTYLLHISQPAAVPVVRAVEPSPYRLLYLHAGRLWSVARDGTRRALAPLPQHLSGAVRKAVASPDGSAIFLITSTGAAQQAWLWQASGNSLQQLAAQPPSAATSRVLSAVWTSPGTLRLLVGDDRHVWMVRYDVSGTHADLETHALLSLAPQQVLSLSPNGRQVALAMLQPATAMFAPQEAVVLEHLGLPKASVALRYLGATPPDAVLWATDNGTVAVARKGLGLALQKSSGRTVLANVHGSLPAVFSRRNAEFAFTVGRNGTWTVHVLSLHDEVDHTAGPPLSAAPSTILWTPDDRVLLYTMGTTLWQLDPSTGKVHHVADNVQGLIIGVVPAGTGFARL